jgi:hypothetical protein
VVSRCQLRTRAAAEILELGPEPHGNPREGELWNEERRGAVALLSALADYDAEHSARVQGAGIM